MTNQQGQVVFLTPNPDGNDIELLGPGEWGCEL